MGIGLWDCTTSSPRRDTRASHTVFVFTVALTGMNGEQAIFAEKGVVRVCVRGEVGGEREF